MALVSPEQSCHATWCTTGSRVAAHQCPASGNSWSHIRWMHWRTTFSHYLTS